MHRYLLMSLAALLTVAYALTTPAFAKNAGLRDHMLEMARGHAQNLSDIEARMRAQTSDQWSEVDVQEYLAEALWTVHYSTWACRFGDSVLPNSPKDLEGGQYCPKWPANPFNNWEPIKVLAATDPFSPGDLTYQVCPPDFYTFMDDTLKPLSYELGIYAPTIEFSSMGDAKPLELNSWSVVPDGTMYMAGAFCETVEMSARKHERRKARKEAAEEAAKQSSDSSAKPEQEEKK